MWYGIGKSKRKDVYKLINDMKGLIHKLNELLPPTVGHVWERDTRRNTNKFYNFKCRTERFSNSLYSVCICKYNIAIDNLYQFLTWLFKAFAYLELLQSG